MRWVDRGSEPAGLAAYRRDYTPLFVYHVQKRMGAPHPAMKPYWLEFRSELAARFNNKCGYCERICGGTRGGPRSSTIDHFKPRSKFPDLTFVWGNWVLSCYECDEIKGAQWADGGFVDPCADDVMERPEAYFDVDYPTGRLMPNRGLDAQRKRRAGLTIDDLGLNRLALIMARMTGLNEFWQAVRTTDESARQNLIDSFTAPDHKFAGIFRMVANPNAASLRNLSVCGFRGWRILGSRRCAPLRRLPLRAFGLGYRLRGQAYFATC